MFNYLLVVLTVIAAVASWMIAKRALGVNGEAKILGFWSAVFGSISSAVILLFFTKDFYIYEIFRSGIVVGFTYSIGYLWIIMYCLKIGPSGPTTTVNNSAMIFGVLYGIIFLNPHLPGALVLIGLPGTIISLVIIGLSGGDKRTEKAINAKWVKLVMLGGSLSGVSFIFIAYIGNVFPGIENILRYIFWANTFAAVILFAVIYFSKLKFYSKAEFIGGGLTGLLSNLSVLINLYLMKFFSTEVIMPVTIVSPMILMLFVGHFYYKEKLSRGAWIGCFLAIISITFLSIG